MINHLSTSTSNVSLVVPTEIASFFDTDIKGIAVYSIEGPPQPRQTFVISGTKPFTAKEIKFLRSLTVRSKLTLGMLAVDDWGSYDTWAFLVSAPLIGSFAS